MTRAGCKSTVHFSTLFSTTRDAFKKRPVPSHLSTRSLRFSIWFERRATALNASSQKETTFARRDNKTGEWWLGKVSLERSRVVWKNSDYQALEAVLRTTQLPIDRVPVTDDLPVLLSLGACPFMARNSQVLANLQSRLTVSGDTFKASAASLTSSPPKKRSSTT